MTSVAREGAVAVVTGAASGIGLGLTRAFLGRGMSVVLADVDEKAIADALRVLDAGARATGAVVDVRRREQVETLATKTLSAYGRVDVVCNNAGVESGGSYTAIPEAAWRWVMDVNFFGAVHGCQVFLPILEEQGHGHLVNTASVAAFASGTPTMTPYCASKFALLGMSESLAAELRDRHSPVRVSLLAPGLVKSRMTDAERNRPADVPPAREAVRLAVVESLAARTAEVGLEPEEVGRLVLEALDTDQFFILPHRESALAGVRARLQWMETGHEPLPRVAGD